MVDLYGGGGDILSGSLHLDVWMNNIKSMMTLASSLDPDQDRQNVGPDLSGSKPYRFVP